MSNDDQNSSGIARSTFDERLISYVYDEMSETQKSLFEKEIVHSPALHEEVSAFKNIKTEIGAWHSQVSPIIEAIEVMQSFNGAGHQFSSRFRLAPPQITEVAEIMGRVRERAKRSTVAAFKAFFELSPNWMRVSVIFASVLFCALMITTFANVEFRRDADGFSVRIMSQPGDTNTALIKRPTNLSYTQAQLDEAVAQARIQMQAEFDAAQPTHTTQPTELIEPIEKATLNASQPRRRRVTPKSNGVMVRNDVFSDGVPRLSDLLDVY